MRISLIHGEDTTAAYQKYRKLVEGSKNKGFSIISITNLRNVNSQSLFEDKVVFTLSKANKVKLEEWKWLAKNASLYNSNLLIYYEGNASALIIKNLPKEVKIERFDLPKIVFSFLENVKPGNVQLLLRLFNEVIIHEPVELVFHFLARHMRDLYWVKVAKDTMDIPEWRKSKLERQAGKFEAYRLQLIINKLSDIDIRSKTSGENLKDLLDIFIVKELK